MLILIDNRTGAPIYDQIFTQIKGQILSGELRADESLPSIRGLAKDLRISVITTKRAYDELERAGYIYTVPGKGSFAAQREEITDSRRTQLLAQLDAIAGELMLLGVTPEEIAARCAAGKEEPNHD